MLERLIDMYEEWGKPEKQSPLVAELAQLGATERIWSQVARAKLEQFLALKPQKPKRNAPCWCGSGKKYKHCHMKSDQQ